MLEGYSPTPRQANEHRASSAMAQVYRRSLAHGSRELAPEGFGRGKQVVLRILSEQDGISLAEIAEAGALDRGNVTRLVSALERDGYLRRETDRAVRHGYKVFLTDTGRAAARRVREVLDAWSDAVFAGVSDAELGCLAELLGKLAARSDELWHAYVQAGAEDGDAAC